MLPKVLLTSVANPGVNLRTLISAKFKRIVITVEALSVSITVPVVKV